MVVKIAIIKLGALGDVVRTTPILEALKEKYPDSEITWITKPDSREIVEDNPYVSKIITIPLKQELRNFDLLYNFDIDEQALNLANAIRAGRKFGYYNNGGFPAAFNPCSEYYLNTIFDDELKKSNKKTYQEMMFEIAELPYMREKCLFYLKNKNYAEKFIEKNKINTDNLIGIHMGSSSMWPSKAWSEEKLEEFIIKAKKKGYEILVFAGPNEREKHRLFVNHLKLKGVKVFQNNPNNSIKQFASLINICRWVICGDTFALHIALALNKSTIALFFCTSPNEIEEYGLLKKIISPLLMDFFPEKSDLYDENLVKSISPEEVMNALNNQQQ